MVTEYIESEKLWRSKKLQINFTSLGKAILDKLTENCLINPDRVLEAYHENGSELTVKDARCQTITVAQNLLQIGVKEGDTVILFSRPNTKITSITFACYLIGAAVNFFDINLEQDVINYSFEKLNPTVIIYEEEFKTKILKAIDSVNPPKLKFVLSCNSQPSSVEEVLFKTTEDIESFEAPEICDPFTLPAILVFTSGSTGMPKIAIHSHAMVLQGLINGWWELPPQSVVCVLCDLRWICQVEMMLQPVFFDVKRVYSSKQDNELTGEVQAEILKTQGVTHYSVVPMLFLELLRNVEETGTISSLDSLQSALLVGEVVPELLVPYAKKILPNCKVIKCYGMTELPGMVVSDEMESQSNLNGGALKDGFLVKIIDENGKSLGPNEKGRLLFNSEVPILGYLKNENANKLAFVGEEGWFETQDYAFMDENKLLNLVTRSKFLLRSSGRTIVPSDVENIVTRHESVLACALIGHSDPVNLDDDIGTVFVVLKSRQNGVDEIETDLKKYLKSKLTEEQLQIVRFLRVIPEMPLTSCSKINRKVLKEIAGTEMSEKYSLL